MSISSKVKREKIDALEDTARNLYKKQGKTMREVAEILGRSHTWVWLALGGQKRTQSNAERKRRQSEQYKWGVFNNASLRRYKGESITYEKWKEHTRDWPKVCLCCGDPFLYNSRTFDHIIHYSNGGRHEIQNIQTLCLKCNSRKGAKSWDFRGNIEMFKS